MVKRLRLEEGVGDTKYLTADGRHLSAEFNVRNGGKRYHEFERETVRWRVYVRGGEGEEMENGK